MTAQEQETVFRRWLDEHLCLMLKVARGCAITPPDQEIVQRLYAAIRQLPKVDASLTLMHLDRLSYLEMADVSGISEN
jgi:hypothetical protein